MNIYAGKATVKQNKFGVWKFRTWDSNEKRYCEKIFAYESRLLAQAIDKAEEMCFDLQNRVKDGRRLFSVLVDEAVSIYMEHRKFDAYTKEVVAGH